MHINLSTVDELLRWVEFLRWRHNPRLRWSIGPVSEQAHAPTVNPKRRFFCKEADVMLQLTDSQDCAVSVAVVDKKGNPALFENASWSASDPNLFTVTQDVANPLAAMIHAVGPLGSGQVNVQVDGLIGAGESFVTGVLDVTIVGGQAAALVISTGTPTEQA